jgi:hypothetical protein
VLLCAQEQAFGGEFGDGVGEDLFKAGELYPGKIAQVFFPALEVLAENGEAYFPEADQAVDVLPDFFGGKVLHVGHGLLDEGFGVHDGKLRATGPERNGGKTHWLGGQNPQAEGLIR